VNPTVAKMAGQIALSLVRSRTGRRLLVAVLVLQLIALTVILWLPTYFASITATSVQRIVVAAPSNCGTETTTAIADDGSPLPRVSDLSPKQVEVGRTIYLTALGVGIDEKWSTAKTERAVLVALATAMQESQLGAYPGIDRPNGDGDAGVFQQRQKPGWYGTLAQVTQVGYAARVFLRGKEVTAADVAAARRAGSGPAGPVGYTIPGLKQVRGWENMPITVAAQKVQRSAFPDAYAKHERISRTLLTVFKEKLDPQSAEAQVTGESVLCGPTDAMSCPPTGLGIEPGLNPDALRVLRCVRQSVPEIRSYIGRADRPGNPTSDHPSGNAVDVMIPDYAGPAGVALGDRVAAWLVANRKKLGVKYVIWNERIWSEQRQSDGWRDYCSTGVPCGDDSSSHRNHIHVSTYGDSAGADVTMAAAASGGPAVLPLSRVVLTARFGQSSSLWARCHTGLDFSAGTGTPIRAVLGGKVVSSGWGGAYGQLTKIEARPGLQFWYAHQSSRDVRVGEVVKTGQVIGRVGMTGNTTGPHLHFEVRQRGSATDPEKWLRNQGLLDG
jgi:hypothetical protein